MMSTTSILSVWMFAVIALLIACLMFSDYVIACLCFSSNDITVACLTYNNIAWISNLLRMSCF